MKSVHVLYIASPSFVTPRVRVFSDKKQLLNGWLDELRENRYMFDNELNALQNPHHPAHHHLSTPTKDAIVRAMKGQSYNIDNVNVYDYFRYTSAQYFYAHIE